MGKLTFIIGGSRSGKSGYAVSMVKKIPGKTAFVATCVPKDEEMKKRVAAHKRARPAGWRTFEAEYCLEGALKKIGNNYGAVIVDCLTIFVSNLLLKGASDKAIERQAGSAIRVLKNSGYASFVVSNEVGMGIVPDNALSRRFRDVAGRVNQVFASAADEVVFMASGIPMKIK